MKPVRQIFYNTSAQFPTKIVVNESDVKQTIKKSKPLSIFKLNWSHSQHITLMFMMISYNYSYWNTSCGLHYYCISLWDHVWEQTGIWCLTTNNKCLLYAQCKHEYLYIFGTNGTKYLLLVAALIFIGHSNIRNVSNKVQLLGMKYQWCIIWSTVV